MSWIMQIIALLAQLQNNALVQDIEQCVLTNTTPAAIWQCVLNKLAGHTISPEDQAKIDAAKVFAAKL